MAFAKKCDRCGELYEFYSRGDKQKMPYTNSPQSINSFQWSYHKEREDSSWTGRVVDLCPKCLNALLIFMELPRIAGKEETKVGQD